MKKKQILSIVLAGTMMTSAAAPVFAVEAIPDDGVTVERETHVLQKSSESGLSDDYIKLPTQKRPKLQEGKTYTVRFNMYNAESGFEKGNDGFLYGKYSMGSQVLKSTKAQLKLVDGKVRTEIKFYDLGGCTSFNYFESEADYEKYSSAEDRSDPEIQALKKGGTFYEPKDGIEYEYKKDDFGNDVLENVTFTESSGNALVYIAVMSTGMGSYEPCAALGFDYDTLQLVDNDIEVPIDPEKPVDPDPEVPDVGNETETDDKFDHPESDHQVIKDFWNVYDTTKKHDYRKSCLNLSEYNLRNINAWLDSTALKVRRGNLTEDDIKQIEKELLEKKKMYGVHMEKAQNIVPGKEYRVPVKFYKVEKGNPVNLFGLKDFNGSKNVASSEICKNNKWLESTAIVRCKNYNYMEMEINLKRPDNVDGWYPGMFTDDVDGSVVMCKDSSHYYRDENGNSYNLSRKPLKSVKLTDHGYGAVSSNLFFTFGEFKEDEKRGRYEDICCVPDFENAEEIGSFNEVSTDSLKKLQNIILYITEKSKAPKYRQDVLDELKAEGGLIERIDKLLKDPDKTQLEVSELQYETEQYLNSRKTRDDYLNEIRLEISGFDPKSYTEKSWNKFLAKADETEKLLKCIDEQDIGGIDWEKYGLDPIDPDGGFSAIMQFYDSVDMLKYKQDLFNIAARNSLVNISGLRDDIKAAEKISNKNGYYTGNSFRAFEEALKQAVKVLNKKDATEGEIEKARENLKKSVEKLYKRADDSKLIASVDHAESLINDHRDEYTGATIKILENAIQKAKLHINKLASGEYVKQSVVDNALEDLNKAKNDLVKKSEANLDKHNLENGEYVVAVNLWHAEQDRPSMGNSALFHTAVLVVDDGKYTLKVKGHGMTQDGQRGELDRFRIITDGSIPNADNSNYKEYPVENNGEDCYIDIPLNSKKLPEFMYGSIIVHTVKPDGSLAYPMGKGWVPNRLRISWDTLAYKKNSSTHPAFAATDEKTGITVTAEEGALPEGTFMEVKKLDSSEVDEALENLSVKHVPYGIYLYVIKDGKKVPVEPADNMEIKVSMPVPEGFDMNRLICFYIDQDKASGIRGLLEDGRYTVIAKGSGIFAISEKKMPEPTWKPDENQGIDKDDKMIDKASPKTGDTSGSREVAGAGLVAVAGLAAFSRRKKRIQED